MKKCGNCAETFMGIEHQPFCEAFGGTSDVSGPDTYAEECEHYKECHCEECKNED